MTLQDRMAIFEKPSDTPNTAPKGKTQPTKFSDRLAAFEAPVPKKAAATPVKSANKVVPEQSGDKHNYKFQVQTHQDTLANKKTGEEQEMPVQNNLKKTPVSSPVKQVATPQKQAIQQSSTPSSNQLKCAACEKTVYVVEQIMIDDKAFHKSCLKCSHCQVVLKLGNYASLEGTYFVHIHSL